MKHSLWQLTSSDRTFFMLFIRPSCFIILPNEVLVGFIKSWYLVVALHVQGISAEVAAKISHVEFSLVCMVSQLYWDQNYAVYYKAFFEI